MTEDRYTRELQQKLDVEKWLGSEEASRDLCGSYIYCPYCNKAEDAPCANAYIRMVNPPTPATLWKLRMPPLRMSPRKRLRTRRRRTLSSHLAKRWTSTT